MMQLKDIRRAQKVRLKDIKLDNRTISKIESGGTDVLLSSVLVYLEAVGMKLTYSL